MVEQKEALKELVKQLHSGLPLEDAKKKFKEVNIKAFDLGYEHYLNLKIPSIKD